MSDIEQYGYKEQLHRGLTTSDLVVYGLMFIPPIAPFALFGIVWQSAKGMVTLAYLVGLSPIGIKEPGMIGVMEPVLGS